MLKYIFTTVPSTVSDQSYRKVLAWRNAMIAITALIVVIACILFIPNFHSEYFSGYIYGLTGGVIGVAVAVLVKAQQLRRKTDEQIHQEKIKEIDERRQYNNLRALKISYLLLIVTLYIFLMYLSSHHYVGESLVLFAIIMLSLGTYTLTRALFNRYQ